MPTPRIEVPQEAGLMNIHMLDRSSILRIGNALYLLPLTMDLTTLCILHRIIGPREMIPIGAKGSIKISTTLVIRIWKVIFGSEGT